RRENYQSARKSGITIARASSDLPAEQRVERETSATPHQEMKRHDRPEQRVLDAARFPVESVRPVIGHDRDDHEDDDGAGRDACQETGCQQAPAAEFENSDRPGPEHAVLEADAFEEAAGAFDVPEQDLVAVERERAARDQADQKLGDRRKDRVKAAERRNEK